MFALPNLTSSAVTRCTPWTFCETPPKEVRKDKSLRSAWINNPTTKWNVYSLVEGLNECVRVKTSGDPSLANDPYRIHGFVADYDVDTPDDWMRREVEKFQHPPQYIERTLSGNWRLIWLFEQPMLVPSAKYLTFFLESVLAHFKVDHLLPGFDRGAWTKPTQYYTNSGDWMNGPEGAQPLSAALVRGWNVEIATKFDWVEEGGVEIPFDVLKKALTEKYPRFSAWESFGLHAMGCTFWVDQSVSPNSAKVVETGIVTFANHAPKGFYTWAELLDQGFVQKFKSERIGKAVEGIYHDSRHYYRKLPGGQWRAFDKQDTRDYLRVSRGLFARGRKGSVTEADKAIQYIQEHQAVDGAGKWVFRPEGVIELNRRKYLNTNDIRALRPSGEPQTWGPEGNFAWISSFLDRFFTTKEQLLFFLSWLAYF
jgi:hypothetical protein